MKYGLIGAKLEHSYSKQLHNLLGNSDYQIRELASGELDDFLRRGDFSGVNVTIPYKQAVMPYCTLDSTAAQIGSVNTIINKNGVLYGYNTDYDGFLYMANRVGIDFLGKKVLILGSGGTSKTVAAAVQNNGASEIVVLSRNGCNCYSNIDKHYDSDIIVNTTPVGMYPNSSDCPIQLDGFSHLSGVIDVIYNPLRTQLILAANERGIASTGGLSMLAAQAYFADRLFFDKQGQVDSVEIEAVVTKLNTSVRSIVLVGMPGCGKTTIGTLLADKLGAQFVDTDQLIKQQTGRSAKEIIESDGEGVFRKIESDIVLSVSKHRGIVIATGGGSVLLEQNRRAFMQNGFIVFLNRPPQCLETIGRPLSMNPEQLSDMYKERTPIYKAMSDVEINVCDNPQDNILKIMEVIE